MKKLTVFSLLFLCLAISYAQDTGKNHNKPFSKGNSSLQLHVGTAGAGLDLRTGLAGKFSARTGFTAIPKITIHDNGGRYDNELTGKNLNIHLLIDYSPFKNNLKSLKFVAGAGYVNARGVVKRSTKEGEFSYGDIPLSKDEVGYVIAETAYKGVAPYAGIGAFNIFGKKKVNVNFDFGTYYLPAPEISLLGEGMLAGMSSERDQLQKNIEGYRWLPLIQLNLNYKF